MTEQPEVMYYITEEELQRACAQMSCAGYGVSANYIEAMVHSRPAQAPEPLETFVLHLLKISQKCEETKRILKTYQRGDLTTEDEDEAAELRGYRDALEWALIPDYPLVIDEHDTAIKARAREEERNKVLNEVRESLSHIKFQDEDMWFIEATIKKIESLRTPKEQP